MKSTSAQNARPYIDKLFNRFVLPNQVYRLPKPIARFLGYRAHPHKEPPPYVVWLSAFVGTFCGLALIAGVTIASPALQSLHRPEIIGSFGAAAILSYNAIEAPLAQPRNAFFGHTISSIVGVAITKLFRLNANYHSLQWLSGTITCAAASAVMSALDCLYPPGGAAALLAATNADIIAMGWYFVPLVMLGTVLMLASALLINNVARHYPKYWWTSEVFAKEEPSDAEKGGRDNQRTHGPSFKPQKGGQFQQIVIGPGGIQLPDDIELQATEQSVLEQLLARLRAGRHCDQTTGSWTAVVAQHHAEQQPKHCTTSHMAEASLGHHSADSSESTLTSKADTWEGTFYENGDRSNRTFYLG